MGDTTEYEKLHWTRKRLLERLQREGGVLMCEMYDGHKVYALRSTGKELNRKPIEKLMEMGFIQPMGDGLFGEAQTFKVSL